MGFEEVKNFKYKFKRISSVDIELIEEFSCGSPELDKKLLQMKDNDDGTTFVFLDETNGQIIGYCTYCASGLKKSYENDSVTYPAAEIKYFAIDKTYQHKAYDEDFNFSDLMLCEVMRRLIEISENSISFDYILLYSVPDAVSFYKRNGFYEFTEFMEHDSYNYINGCIPMFFPL